MCAISRPLPEQADFPTHDGIPEFLFFSDQSILNGTAISAARPLTVVAQTLQVVSYMEFRVYIPQLF
jgi:hypothetical protein